MLLNLLVPNCFYLYARIWLGCRRVGPNRLPARGPALVIANHPTHADAAILVGGCRRWIRFIQAREYFDVFLLRPFFRLLGCIPVSRGEADPSGIRAALKHLRRGDVVGLFPEGDLTPAQSHRQLRGQTGAALLALRGRVPVIPAFIVAPPGRGVVLDWVRPAHGVRVSFGPPVELSPFYGRPITHARLRQVADLLMQRIADLHSDCVAAGTN
jgi:1-acyl-sn-glycerol-3-phosphate acyltransferase